MSESKKVKVEACSVCRVEEGQVQRAWGVDFTAVKGKGKNSDLRLVAEIDQADADNFIEHGQCVKA